MAVTFVVDYEVKDYEIWKKTFDSNSDVRKAAGVKASPFRKIDNEKIVYVIGEAPSKNILERFPMVLGVKKSKNQRHSYYTLIINRPYNSSNNPSSQFQGNLELLP